MEIKLMMNKELFECLCTGRRIQGALYLERLGNEIFIRFNQYQRIRPKRRHDQTLHVLPHGWLRKSAKRYRLHLSLPDNLGESRVADLMASETEEARNFMSALKDVLDVA